MEFRLANSVTGGGSEAVVIAPATPAEALRLYGAWLRAVAVARLKTTQGADDVMQEVAAAAVKNWSTLQSQSNAKPWLYRLTVRAALMHRRSLGRARKRIVQASEVAVMRSDASRPPDPLEILLSSERAAMLRQAMTKLPSRDTEMLMMKHVDDCSYKEIAARMGFKCGTVGNHLQNHKPLLRLQSQ